MPFCDRFFVSERERVLWLDFNPFFIILIIFCFSTNGQSDRRLAAVAKRVDRGLLLSSTTSSEAEGKKNRLLGWKKRLRRREKTCKETHHHRDASFCVLDEERKRVVQPFFSLPRKFETFHPLFVLSSGYNNSSSISHVI